MDKTIILTKNEQEELQSSPKYLHDFIWVRIYEKRGLDYFDSKQYKEPPKSDQVEMF